MHFKAKSENLAHSLGCQTGAVTTWGLHEKKFGTSHTWGDGRRSFHGSGHHHLGHRPDHRHWWACHQMRYLGLICMTGNSVHLGRMLFLPRLIAPEIGVEVIRDDRHWRRWGMPSERRTRGQRECIRWPHHRAGGARRWPYCRHSPSSCGRTQVCASLHWSYRPIALFS